ncbi:hypothetical protein DEO72_LG6g1015 [Vigna unguiculata]|uniref:Uncharacterized protein n=1 Tax=Vigna unguiculata TaxID=3917 RepID=A0A4D6M6B9_VIGUN|nr:hypothetical protein DEO72_LG6g1015 [Vigna unguiculata]
MFTFKAKIQTDWAELVCDTILKAIGLPMYPLPYEIFLPKAQPMSGVKPRTDFERCVLKHLSLLTINHQTYMAKFDKLDKQMARLMKKNQNEDEENEDASHEGYDEDDNVVEEDDMSDDLN